MRQGRWRIWIKIKITNSIRIRIIKIIELYRLLEITLENCAPTIMVSKGINAMAEILIEIKLLPTP